MENQEACVLSFPEDLTHSEAFKPPPQVGLRGSIEDPKLWSPTAVMFPDCEQGRSSVLLSSQPRQGHSYLFKAGVKRQGHTICSCRGTGPECGYTAPLCLH